MRAKSRRQQSAARRVSWKRKQQRRRLRKKIERGEARVRELRSLRAATPVEQAELTRRSEAAVRELASDRKRLRELSGEQNLGPVPGAPQGLRLSGLGILRTRGRQRRVGDSRAAYRQHRSWGS